MIDVGNVVEYEKRFYVVGNITLTTCKLIGFDGYVVFVEQDCVIFTTKNINNFLEENYG